MSTPLRVLIVEDDAVDRMACRRAFAAAAVAAADAAFELLEADSGEQGLELARSERPDCILLDYHLPDLTGLEFLAHLNEDGAAQGIPVMMLTGADSAAVAAEAMRRGARDYLVKDVDGYYLEFLPGAIHRMLREQQLLDDKRQVEAQFRTLVEQMQAISYIAELDGALRYISPQIGLLGYSAAEWLADAALHGRLMDPEQREATLAALQASRRDGSPLHLEYRLHARDGRALWLRDQAELVRDEQGQPLFMQGIMIDITQTKLGEQALLASQQALRSLSAHQEQIKENERKRIAQEIHDELGGLLTGIKAYIAVSIERAEAAAAPAEPLLAEAAGLAQDAIDTVRRVITDLRPSVLDQLGVWAALEWYAEQVERRSGLHCQCTVAAAAGELELDAGRSTMLFRIAQEALTNVVRHAGASNAALQVDYADGVLELRISDDGQGIAAERLLNRESWGILGMHERCRHFDGELKITGLPGQGTTLLLRLPLDEQHEY
ncbi:MULTISPECIES: response regulator [unclassified Duganella]|uniref:response regulator n=1 Tax=unclassified Duganella TaxID=2636909 RepID=UPI000E341DB0|nr:MULTISPECIES: response regulator [unclassified Duganella]RFP13873.1 response regulator [Duganella sp. BJB475]RFP36583.1 response regulator [Duganella sp. BJB476]